MAENWIDQSPTPEDLAKAMFNAAILEWLKNQDWNDSKITPIQEKTNQQLKAVEESEETQRKIISVSEYREKVGRLAAYLAEEVPDFGSYFEVKQTEIGAYIAWPNGMLIWITSWSKEVENGRTFYKSKPDETDFLSAVINNQEEKFTDISTLAARLGEIVEQQEQGKKVRKVIQTEVGEKLIAKINSVDSLGTDARNKILWIVEKAIFDKNWKTYQQALHSINPNYWVDQQDEHLDALRWFVNEFNRYVDKELSNTNQFDFSEIERRVRLILCDY